MRSALRAATTAALVTTLAPVALGMQTDNRGIHAVPVPGRVVIDGSLDDWDLSGQVLVCYNVETLKDVYSGRVTMMHDSDAFYVSVHWKDPVPMGNSHDPRFQSGKGWAGDCVQLRVKTDRICHVTAWYYAANDEPFMNIEYGKSLNEPFGGGGKNLFRTGGWKLDEGAEMAFRRDADGRGYVQEMKLPWGLIMQTSASGEPRRRYSPGQGFRCGVELLWGEADWPVHRYADNLADGATSREFFWTAKDAWGEVKIEAKGKLSLPAPPWEEAVAEQKPEGPVEIRYSLPKDSRVTLAIDDSSGKRIRNLLAAAERKAGRNVDLWDGLDDAGEVVQPGRYTVKGLFHEGLHLEYVGSFASPGNPPWGTADGKGGYYGDHTAPQAVAAGGDRLALACPMGEAGKHLIGVDLQGRRQWGLANRRAFGGGVISLATDGTTLWVANADAKDGKFTIWRCELATGKYSPWDRKDEKGEPVLDLPIGGDGMANLRAIAYHDGMLAVIVAKERKLLVLDAGTGEVQEELDDLADGMSACAFTPRGELLLAAGSTVSRVDLRKGRLKRVVKRVDEPMGVACDAEGRIYVSQRGMKHNVAVFSRRGRPLREIGVPGGRPESGTFDENGMCKPRQIAIDSEGRLWVTEETHSPKRTSVWNADGTLASDLVGTTGYAAGGIVNPFDHTRGFSENVEYRLDFENGTFRPLFTLEDALGTGFGFVTKITRVKGREYMQIRSTARDSAMVKLFLRDDDGAWWHVAEWGNVGLGKSIDEEYHRKWNAKFKAPLWQGLFGKAFLWVDRNGDGRASRDEIETTDKHLGAYYWGQMMADDLTVTVPVRGGEMLVFKPEGFTVEGVPLYSFRTSTSLKPKSGMRGEGMMAAGRGGRYYLNQGPLTAVNSSGDVLWTYPNHYVSVHGSHRAPAASPGLLIGPSSFYGTASVSDEIGEVFYLNGNLGQNFIFTEDGLWVQGLYNDCRGWFDVPAKAVRGMSCDAMTAGGESFGGGFCKSDDGRFYTVGGGTAAVVMEVTGLQSLRRFGLEVRVTERDIAEAQELKVKLAARKMAAKVYTVRRVAKPLPTEGDLGPWKMDTDSLEIQSGRHKVGRIKAAYDSRNLYLGYEVNDGSPLRNSGQDEKLMFITGDCVDLMLRTDSSAKGAKPVKGDLRLLMTVRGGKPLAVLYRPVAAGTKSPGMRKADRVAFSSPWRTVWMDRVEVVEFPLTLKKAGRGYAVTAAVPLEILGVKSLTGRTLRGDFGILGSDSAGRECTSRNYWSNKTTNNTNDLPDEVMITPALWGELRFESFDVLNDPEALDG